MLRASNLIIALFSASLSMGLVASSHGAETSDIDTQKVQMRIDYLAAKKALDNGQRKKYTQLRAKLDNYPLSLYLDYHTDKAKILTLKANQANLTLEKYSDSPLYSSLKHQYLLRAGKKNHWTNFLAVAQTLPRNTQLQCYYYRAQFADGQIDEAYLGAKRLWLYGKSRPKACDPLFKTWTKAGQKTQELIWQRLLLAFDARQYGLVKYLARKVTKQPHASKALLSVYQDPQRLRHTKKFNSQSAHYSEIVFLGIKRLARRNLTQAVKLYQKYLKQGRFSQYQQQRLARYLTRRALVKQEVSLKDFISKQLKGLASDELYEMRIRWAIKTGELTSVPELIGAMSLKQQQTPRWQYWQQRLSVTASKIQSDFDTLAEQRNFYGFVTSENLKRSISLNDQPTSVQLSLSNELINSPALARVAELLILNKQIDARAEWQLLLQGQNTENQSQLGQYAINKNWHSLGVQASIQAKLWNNMAMRFPFAADSSFKKASNRYKVDIDEIRSIARRESAFYPSATSGVGARGMMQLMPNTAKQTAKRHKIRYKRTRQLYDVDLNIQLGSAYYSSLLKQFNNNRVLAAAAYNAGPHRVKRWLKNSQGQLDLMAFIETIPFRETREYVQAVISYRVIYQARQQKKVGLFTDNERNFAY